MTEAQHAPPEMYERYRDFIETASDLVWEIDAVRRWTFLNAASQRLYGWRPSELVGTVYDDVVDPTRRAGDRDVLTRLLAGGPDLVDYGTVHRDRFGTAHHMSISARAMRDGAGTIRGVRGIARDVSDRVAAQEALRVARDEAEEAMRTRSAFLAAMSHEIRTPMNGILGMTELLLDSDLRAEHTASIELIRTSAEALLEIINDILDFSKIESGHIDLEDVSFDLPGLVDSIMRLLAPRASRKGIELVHDVRPDVPERVRGDPGRIRQVLNNLVGNALKFTERGEVAVRVSVEQSGDHRCTIRFGVADTGIGIPADKVDGIFDEYKQADLSTTRKYGGTGLGLAISRRIVERMHGIIGVQSTLGEGSEFHCLIPLIIVSRSTSPAAPVAFEGLRALVVDDHATNRRIVREMLGSARMSVDEAADVDDALAKLRDALGRGEPYGLAIVDARMPDRDGFELAEEVRTDRALRAATPLMVLTAAGRPGDGERCRQLGIAAYLSKPVSRPLLLEAVARARAGRDEGHGAGALITRYSLEEERARLRILLAEDNPVNQKIATTMLERRGHQVTVVETGVTALEAVRESEYDVILMDIQMPEMDGVEATTTIRRHERGRRTPIIALTAHAFESEKQRCLEAGMDAVLTKPFKPHELFGVVEQWGTLPDPLPTADSSQTTAVPASLLPREPPVDLVGLRRMMREAGAEEAVAPMIEVYLADAPGRFEAVEASIAAGDASAIERSAHAFKSATGSIAASDLASKLGALEMAARDGAVQTACAMLEGIRVDHHVVIDFLTAEISAGA